MATSEIVRLCLPQKSRLATDFYRESPEKTEVVQDIIDEKIFIIV
jgi:hypothetical protein